jgi:regulator of sigma E protease
LGTTQVAAFAEDAVSSQQLQVEDTILKINGHRVRSDNDLKYELMRVRNGSAEMVVSRPGVEGNLTLDVPFRMNTVEGASTSIIYFDFQIYGVPPTFWGVVKNAFNWTGSYVKMVWGSMVDLVTGRFGFNDLSGPVGVTQAISEASSAGIQPFLSFVAFITVNLGVFNLLPIPALDGGRLLFLLVELVRRKPLNPKYEGYVNAAGFMLLIGLMIAVTFSDLVKLFTK